MENKLSETKPKVLKNFFSGNEINKFIDLYQKLPVTVHNKKQNVIKKRWLQKHDEELEKFFFRD